MNIKWELCVCLLSSVSSWAASQTIVEKAINLKEIRSLVQQNRSIIIQDLHQQVVTETLKQGKTDLLPNVTLGGDGYFKNVSPLHSSVASDNSLFYHFNITSEFDLYTGGRRAHAIARLKKEQEMSEEELKRTQQEIELQAYILLYDIHRNIKYRDFLRSSIYLRKKEYERINNLYRNGVVLKSDLLRAKLYITNLQKDEVTICNSIEILSDQFRTLLAIDEYTFIYPDMQNDLHFKLDESFESLYQYALQYSPMLKIHRIQKEHAETKLKEICSAQLPHLKLYAQYGVGSPLQPKTYDHQLGGEFGAKVSFSLSSLYHTKHQKKAQKHRIQQAQWHQNDEEEKLRCRMYELFTRYHESLVNIDRALAKIEMSNESNRILKNSYFNQQTLLIDVLESETQAMEASFEWVEAVVDSQKYYWALQQICGRL